MEARIREIIMFLSQRAIITIGKAKCEGHDWLWKLKQRAGGRASISWFLYEQWTRMTKTRAKQQWRKCYRFRWGLKTFITAYKWWWNWRLCCFKPRNLYIYASAFCYIYWTWTKAHWNDYLLNRKTE